MAKVTLQNISKSYFVSGSEKKVITDLSAELDTGKRIAILGKSGCGKTTLLRILAGLTSADKGQVIVPDELRIGYVFQEDRLFPWMTAAENVAAAIREKRDTEKLTEAALATVGLEDFCNAFPSQLSGGMRKKVAFARCLAFQPDWIVMDEPFSALDYFERNRLQDELLAILREQGMGFLLVTHHVDEAMKLAEEVCIMGDGILAERFVIPQFSPEQIDSLEYIRIKKEILNGCKKCI